MIFMRSEDEQTALACARAARRTASARRAWPGVLTLLGALAGLVAPVAGMAQERGGNGEDIGRVEETGRANWQPEFDEDRRHHLSLLIGTTTLQGEGTAFTSGLDYEYRVNRTFGIGAVAEYAAASVGSFTLLAVTDIHLWRGLALQVGPGIEIIDEEVELAEHDGEDVEVESEQLEQFVFRAGLLYEFELGKFTLAPQAHFDVVPGSEPDSLVLAVAFGRAF
jgi:hypothetical protein